MYSMACILYLLVNKVEFLVTDKTEWTFYILK
jgi:hypothetical protein